MGYAMIRLATLLAASLLLVACASTPRHYHGSGGADYYYGDSYGYYDRRSDITWSGYVYPVSHGWGPAFGWNSGWYGSSWLGYGYGYGSSWGYPGYAGYYWSRPWWYYNPVYAAPMHPTRYSQAVRSHQARQAGLAPGARRAAGPQSMTTTQAQQAGLVSSPTPRVGSASWPSPVRAPMRPRAADTSSHVPNAPVSVPRGQPMRIPPAPASKSSSRRVPPTRSIVFPQPAPVTHTPAPAPRAAPPTRSSPRGQPRGR